MKIKNSFESNRPAPFKYGIFIIMLIAAIGFYLYNKNHKSVSPTPGPVVATPIESPVVPQGEVPPKPEVTPESLLGSNFKPPVLYTNKDTLCLLNENNVFILPRQIAIDITRKRLNVIYLPAEYTTCLKTGQISFRITDFDRKSLFPFRHYLDLKTTIVRIESLTSDNAPKAFIKDKLEQFNQIFTQLIGKTVTKVTIGSFTVENKNFLIDSRLPLFSKTIEAKPFQPVSLAELLKSYPILKNKFVPPSHPVFETIFKNWDSKIDTFVVDSKYEFWQANFEAAYYLHFKKPSYVYFNITAPIEKPPPRNWIYRDKLLPELQTALFVDLRPSKTAAHFNFKNHLRINVDLRGARHYQEVVDRLDSNSFFQQRMIQFYTAEIMKNMKILDSKKIILIGLADEDVLVEAFFKLLPENIQRKTLIYRSGFYDLILSSYFYKTNYFLPEKNFDIYNETDIINYLHLSF